MVKNRQFQRWIGGLLALGALAACSDVKAVAPGSNGADIAAGADVAFTFAGKDVAVAADSAAGADVADVHDAPDSAAPADVPVVDVAPDAADAEAADAQADVPPLADVAADVPALADVPADAAEPDVPPPDVPAPDVPPPPLLGCIQPSQPAGGFVDLAIGPTPAQLVGLWGAQPTLQFTVQGVAAGGSTAPLTGATWDVDPPAAGSIDATGLFTASGSFGGTATVSAHFQTLCKSASLQMKVQWVDTTSEPSPGIGAVLANTPATDAPTGISLLYPPPNTMAPMDFSPITAQWTYAAAQNANAFVLRFDSDAAQIDVVGGAKWQVSGGYAVTIPTTAWQKLFQFSAVKSWNLRVIAATTSGKVVTGTPIQTPAQAFGVALQKAGGAIYYWNTSLLGVRVLEPGKPAASIPTPGGFCAGCHSISPDGSTIAVSFMMGATGSSMSMGLFTAKSGLNPPWLNATAKTKLASSFTIAAAFSKAYFNATDKRLVVPSAPLLFATNLFSIDLLKGTETQLVTGGDLGQQAFPTWSPDGSTVTPRRPPPSARLQLPSPSSQARQRCASVTRCASPQTDAASAPRPASRDRLAPPPPGTAPRRRPAACRSRTGCRKSPRPRSRAPICSRSEFSGRRPAL